VDDSAGTVWPIPVKICGLTRPEDAEAAARLGARWLGVVFAGGPREISPAAARAIGQAVPGGTLVGVFKSLDPDEILRVRDAAGLTGAQLHGGVSPALAERLTLEGMFLFTVLHLANQQDVGRLEQLRSLGAAVLVEPRVPGALGGTGVALSIPLARQARAALRGHTMVLAGGLTPESVADTVRAVGPDAVDVSSGVEQIPGIKDHSRMTRFMKALGWA
jgi:phosphoribosylanthranilate isomerase